MNNSDRSEKLIILKLQSGDDEAYKILYLQYSDPLRRFIYFKTGDRELAKDLMHDVFARFMRLANKEHITEVRAYLYRIARNLIIDFYKESGKRKLIPVEETKTKELRSIIGKEAIEAKLDLEIAYEAIENLKPAWRDIVIMRLIEGLEYEEISQIIGKSENSIRVNLHRAIKKLREIFELDK